MTLNVFYEISDQNETSCILLSSKLTQIQSIKVLGILKNSLSDNFFRWNFLKIRPSKILILSSYIWVSFEDRGLKDDSFCKNCTCVLRIMLVPVTSYQQIGILFYKMSRMWKVAIYNASYEESKIDFSFYCLFTLWRRYAIMAVNALAAFTSSSFLVTDLYRCFPGPNRAVRRMAACWITSSWIGMRLLCPFKTIFILPTDAFIFLKSF